MDDFYKSNVYGYSIEPTSPKGIHRYLDLVSELPQHIRNRSDLMEIIYLFQDYLNDGYRLIPSPTTTYSYKTAATSACTSATTTSYTEVRRPFNHTPSMYKDAIVDSIGYGATLIETYDKERDLDTWAIDFTVMDKYKADNSEILYGDDTAHYSYYNEAKIYLNSLDFYAAISDLYSNTGNINVFTNVFMYISLIGNSSNISMDETSLTLEQLTSLLPTDVTLPEIIFNYYACDAKSFLADFVGFKGNTNVEFTVQSRKMQYFYGISDATDYNNVPTFATLDENGNQKYVKYDNLGIDSSFNNSFRVSFGLPASSSSSDILAMLELISKNCTGTFSMMVYPKSIEDVAAFAVDGNSIIASSLLTIYKYQHPEVFYSTFSYQNEYRHDAKGGSVAEKIYRLAYSKDPRVFDYEYLRLIAQHFGYSMETDEEEINQNSYYKTKEEKEMVLRQLISNMPEYNRMKGTNSGLEMVLLSFGLVGRIVTLYTRGNDKMDGYAEFIDSRLIDGDIDDFADANNIQLDTSNKDQEDQVSVQMSAQFKNNPLLSGTSIYDWYASPHFRIEFDLLKDYLNISRNSNQFSIIAKTIKRIKPINTVFQGFYAKLSAEYGSLFISPPVIMNKVKQIMFVETGCSFSDNWSEQCALELEYDN